MMISEKMNAKLNEQITAEFSASHAYLAMACAFDQMGLKVLAKRFIRQHHEEHEHAMKIISYLMDVNARVELNTIPKPKHDYKGALEIVRAALDSEKKVTGMINELVGLAESEKDYATRSFLNWFVDEQVEEESGMSDLLDLVRLAGDNLLQVELRVRHEMMAKS